MVGEAGDDHGGRILPRTSTASGGPTSNGRARLARFGASQQACFGGGGRGGAGGAGGGFGLPRGGRSRRRGAENGGGAASVSGASSGSSSIRETGKRRWGKRGGAGERRGGLLILQGHGTREGSMAAWRHGDSGGCGGDTRVGDLLGLYREGTTIL